MSQFGRLAVGLGIGLALLGSVGHAGAGECEIVLGSAISLTGPAAEGGLHVKSGYDFAVDELNEAGGVEIGGRLCSLRIVYYDAGSEPERGAELARRLIGQDRVRFLLGPHDAAVTAAIAPVAEKHRVPMLAAADLGRAMQGKGHEHLFAMPGLSIRALDPVVGLAAEMARAAGKEPHEVRVAMAFTRDRSSLELRAGLSEAIARHGLTVVLDARLAEDLADMGAKLALAKGLRPDLLVVSGRERGAATAVRKIRDMRVGIPIIAVTHCEAAAVVAGFGKAAEGILCPGPWAPEMANSDEVFGSASAYDKAFRTAFPEYADTAVPYQAARASAAVLVFADAFRRAGSLDAEAVRQALAGTDLATFYGRIGFAGGEREPVLVRQIQDGAYVVVAPPELATGELRYPRP